jgi:hypothetical protein
MVSSSYAARFAISSLYEVSSVSSIRSSFLRSDEPGLGEIDDRVDDVGHLRLEPHGPDTEVDQDLRAGAARARALRENGPPVARQRAGPDRLLDGVEDQVGAHRAAGTPAADAPGG